MPVLAFALDEDVPHGVASLLRSLGRSADSAKELGRLRLSDPQVLLLAATNGQTLVTRNSKDFPDLHEAWLTWRQHWADEVERMTGIRVALSRHAGILITPHLPIYDLTRILEELEDVPGSMDDRLLAWSEARGWHESRF